MDPNSKAQIALPKLEPNVPICISTFPPDTVKGPKTQNTNDPHNPHLGSSTLVPPTSGNGHTQPDHPTTNRRTIIKSTGNDSPATTKWNSKTSGMADLRRRMQNSGLSKSASRLIVNRQLVQDTITTQPGKSSLAGVINNKLIHFDALLTAS